MGVKEHEAVSKVVGEKEGAKLVDGRIDGRSGGEKVQERHDAHEEDGERQQVLPRGANEKKRRGVRKKKSGVEGGHF